MIKNKSCGELGVGDVVASGEVVLAVGKVGRSRNVKGSVKLRNLKTDKVRWALWAWWGTIYMSHDKMGNIVKVEV